MNVIPYTEWDGSAPAIVADMPISDYHAHESISNSGLTLIARSPAHYHHAPRWKGSRFTEIGTAFHTALLEPERYQREYITVADCDDRRTAAYKDAAKTYGGDKTLTASEGAAVEVMAESVRANAAAADALAKPGWAELSLFVNDPETGVLMRCRFDYLTEDGNALDVKKTQDCREFAFAKSVHLYRYHVQAAMYSHVYELVTGKPLVSYQMLAIEEAPPCANVLYDIDPLATAHGFTLYREALAEYARCLYSDTWPSYSGTGVVTLPEWVLASLELTDDEQEEF